MLAEPSTNESVHEPEHLEHVSPGAERTADIQTTLSAAMNAAQVRASFDLDCAARPCLAVFAGQVPSEEQRATVLRQLHESQPDLELMSTTIIDEDGRVSWVLGLADEALTPDERALVDARVDDLLPRVRSEPDEQE